MKSYLNSLLWGKLGNKYTPYQKKLFISIFIIFTILLIYFIYSKAVYGNKLPFTFESVIMVFCSVILMSVFGLLIHQASKKSGLYDDPEYKTIRANHIPRYLVGRTVVGTLAVVILLLLFFLFPGLNFILQIVITAIITIPLYFVIYKILE